MTQFPAVLDITINTCSCDLEAVKSSGILTGPFMRGTSQEADKMLAAAWTRSGHAFPSVSPPWQESRSHVVVIKPSA